MCVYGDSNLFVAGKKYNALKNQERIVWTYFVLFLELCKKLQRKKIKNNCFEAVAIRSEVCYWLLMFVYLCTYIILIEININ